MPQAYAKAAGSVGMAAPRQIFYVARPLILAALGAEKDLSSTYFTQTLLPDYMDRHPAEASGWDVIWDDRGHFTEPHTRKTIGLGTLAVRKYLAACSSLPPSALTLPPISTDFPTRGPQNRYNNVLLIEKEGFQQIFERAGIDTRFDLSIMSSKGMNSTSARALVERLPNVRVFVLHDFDKSGLSILGTLTRSTRRYQFKQRADVVDLGIRLQDVEEEGLASERVVYTKRPEGNLRLNSATDAEVAFLMAGGGQRVELNAFDNDHLIAWLERKLQQHGVEKLIPNEDLLAEAYRRAVLIHNLNGTITHVQDAAEKATVQVPVP